MKVLPKAAGDLDSFVALDKSSLSSLSTNSSPL